MNLPITCLGVLGSIMESMCLKKRLEYFQSSTAGMVNIFSIIIITLDGHSFITLKASVISAICTLLLILVSLIA